MPDVLANMQEALRVIDQASAQMSEAVEVIKRNGNVVSSDLLDSMMRTHESVADLARGLIAPLRDGLVK